MQPAVIQLDGPRMGDPAQPRAPELLQNPLCAPKTQTEQPTSPELDHSPTITDTFCDAEGGQNLHIQYETIPHLSEDLLAALRKYDTDNDGSISLSELVSIANSNQKLSRTVMYLAVLLLLLLLAMFGISWWVEILASETSVNEDSHAMVEKASDFIVQTSLASQTVALTYTALLNPELLGRIHQITFNKMRIKQDNRWNTILQTFIMNVDSLWHFNETYVQFYSTAHTVTVTINMGVITLRGVPAYPDQTLEACAHASCSAVSISGVDVSALRVRARELGYAGSDENRRWSVHELWCDAWSFESVEEASSFSCGSEACSPGGGQCVEKSSWFHTSKTCECDEGFGNRASQCDWGPIPSTYKDDEWTQEELKRIKLTYDASNAMYYTSSSTWVPAVTNSNSEYSENSDNSDLENSAWYQDCNGFTNTFESFKTYMFSQELSSDTHIGFGRVRADYSPDGTELLLVSFGGTKSADSRSGELDQFIADGKVDLQAAYDLSGTYIGSVHIGFWNSVKPYFDTMLELMAPELEQLPQWQEGTFAVTVTGHSLGAACATVFARLFRDKYPHASINVVSFGTPRSGTPVWVQGFETLEINTLRVVNGIDIFSMIPTSLGSDKPAVHTKGQITLGYESVSPGCQNFFINYEAKALEALDPYSCAYEGYNDHTSYREPLAAWLQSHGLEDNALQCTENF